MRAFYRLLHASPNAPAVDVYANGLLLVHNLSYRQFTEYRQIAPGDYTITVFPAGTRVNPVLETVVTIPPNVIVTVAAVNLVENLDLQIVSDTTPRPAPNRVKIKFVHLSPNAPNVDITLPDGTILAPNLAYREISDYIFLPPAVYTFQARLAGTPNVVLTVPNQRLLGGRILTGYVIGLVGARPPLQMLTPLEGSTYIHV